MNERAGNARKRLGARGERLVADALQARGFDLVAHNVRSRWGEIDIVARKGDTVWFVEVKSRSARSGPPPTVSWKQRHRLTRMAYDFLQQYDASFDTVQFVLAAVFFDSDPPRIEWMEHAFEGTF